MNSLRMNSIIFYIPVIPEYLMLDDKSFYTIIDIIDLFENKLKIDKVIRVEIKDNVRNGRKIKYAFVHFSDKSKNAKLLYDFINSKKDNNDTYEYHIDGYFNFELKKRINFYSSKDNSPRYIVLKNSRHKTIFNTEIKNEILLENNSTNLKNLTNSSEIKSDLINSLDTAYDLIIKQQKYITELESIISRNRFI